MPIIYEKKRDILAALREEHKHGYRLADELGISTGYIYVHLDELEEAGLIDVAEQEESGRQRVYYRLTDDGEQLLEILGE